MYVSQVGTKQNKTGKRNPTSSSHVPVCHHESQWKRNLFGSLAICFSVYTQNSKWVNAAGTPSATLTLICLIVFWYSAGQEWCHTVMVPYITPPPTRTQVSIQWQQSNNNVWVSVSVQLEDAVQYWEIKTNGLRDEINNQLQVELSDSYFNHLTLFSIFLFTSILYSSPFPSFLSLLF